MLIVIISTSWQAVQILIHGSIISTQINYYSLYYIVVWIRCKHLLWTCQIFRPTSLPTLRYSHRTIEGEVGCQLEYQIWPWKIHHANPSGQLIIRHTPYCTNPIHPQGSSKDKLHLPHSSKGKVCLPILNLWCMRSFCSIELEGEEIGAYLYIPCVNKLHKDYFASSKTVRQLYADLHDAREEIARLKEQFQLEGPANSWVLILSSKEWIMILTWQ